MKTLTSQIVNVTAPPPNAADYSFIAASGTITVTGFIWTDSNDVIKSGVPFTASLLTSEAQNILDFLAGQPIPVDFIGMTLTFSGDYYFSCDGGEANLEANPTRCPRVNGPVTRSFGIIPQSFSGFESGSETVFSAPPIWSSTANQSTIGATAKTINIANYAGFTFLTLRRGARLTNQSYGTAAPDNIRYVVGGPTASATLGDILSPGASALIEGAGAISIYCVTASTPFEFQEWQ